MSRQRHFRDCRPGIGKGIDGLMALVQSSLRQKPVSGSIFAFRGRRGDRIKLLFWDGQGFCLYYKVLEKGRFPWPSATDGTARLRSRPRADRLHRRHRRRAPREGYVAAMQAHGLTPLIVRGDYSIDAGWSGCATFFARRSRQRHDGDRRAQLPLPERVPRACRHLSSAMTTCLSRRRRPSS
nr:IS66 family insertion sequence element accessory protein TnpB [Shinella zoogloeoides]